MLIGIFNKKIDVRANLFFKPIVRQIRLFKISLNFFLLTGNTICMTKMQIFYIHHEKPNLLFTLSLKFPIQWGNLYHFFLPDSKPFFFT